MSRGVSPLERRLLLALVSLIRDREPDPDEWTITDIPLRALYERCYRLDPGRSYELQRRNQRQTLRRALGRLHEQGFVHALALAWVDVEDWTPIRWQGGGSRSYRGSDYASRYGEDTPRWRMVGLNDVGIKLAHALEQEQDTTHQHQENP